jgi:hypothetical protein
MVNLIIALVVVFGGWWALRKLATAQPAQIRAAGRKIGGAGLMAAAAVFALRGGIQIAGPLFVLGLGMFTNVAAMMKPGAFWKKAEGQKSKVRTTVLEMELDHDTGQMDGVVLAGALAGKKLSSLTHDQLSILHAQCSSAGDQSAALLEAWLQRTQSEFKAAGAASGQTRAGPGKMTREEALAVLGLRGSPSPEEIKTAHRSLMKQFHPDRGGNDYLASKINAAKDVLL